MTDPDLIDTLIRIEHAILVVGDSAPDAARHTCYTAARDLRGLRLAVIHLQQRLRRLEFAVSATSGAPPPALGSAPVPASPCVVLPFPRRGRA